MSTMIVPMRRAMPEHPSLDRVRGDRPVSPLGIPCEPDCVMSKSRRHPAPPRTGIAAETAGSRLLFQEVASGEWLGIVASGEQSDNRWQMADGRWQMADDKWQTAPWFSLATCHSSLATPLGFHSPLATRHSPLHAASGRLSFAGGHFFSSSSPAGSSSKIPFLAFSIRALRSLGLLDLYMTSFSSTRPCFQRLKRLSSSRIMPCLRPVWIDESMRYVLFSRIRLEIAGVITSIS